MNIDVAMPQLGETVAEGTVTRWRAHRPRHAHSPRVRRLAAGAGLSLDDLRGSGPRGRVTPGDVAAAEREQRGESLAEAPAPTPIARSQPSTQHDGGVPISTMKDLVADREMQSLGGTAPLTTVVEVDVTRVVNQRRATARALQERCGVHPTLTAFFAAAALEALREVSILNASIGPDGRSVTHHMAQHLGITVDTESGVMVPVVKDAGDLSLLGLSGRIGEVAARARSGAIRPDELDGATFTITNVGGRGALFDTAMLSPGQVGILSTGAAVERPAVVLGKDGARVIAIRLLAHFALTYDRRLVDGADAARFLTVTKARLEAGRFQHKLD